MLDMERGPGDYQICKAEAKFSTIGLDALLMNTVLCTRHASVSQIVKRGKHFPHQLHSRQQLMPIKLGMVKFFFSEHVVEGYFLHTYYMRPFLTRFFHLKF